jgi:CheY-like chemotaxis protein
MLAVRPDIPVIVCTGFSEKINEQIARDIGIKGFLMKPIVISQLACMVRSALDGFSH